MEEATMSFLEKYHEFRDKQKFIQRLKENKKMGTTTLTAPEPTVAEVLKKVFDENHIGYNSHDLELAEDVIRQCKENQYNAYKAATIICQEMEMDLRWNRGAVEQALKDNNILNN
jgi:hypothetical protein